MNILSDAGGDDKLQITLPVIILKNCLLAWLVTHVSLELLYCSAIYICDWICENRP